MPNSQEKAALSGSARSTPAPTAKRRGWWRRNWWKLVLVVVLVPLLGGGGFVFWKYGPIMFSKPYRIAFEDLRRNRKMIDQLGEPISGSWIPGGSVDSDSAQLYFDIWGPKAGKPGKAQVVVKAGFRGGEWGFSQFEVTLADGQHLNLMDDEERIHGVDTPKDDGHQKGVSVQQATPDQDIVIPDVSLPDPK